ncbi:MAG TPA: helicase-exonuclease AddAB subunit AddA, partial [Bacillota bacterium]|nr:helicase-exonuclease AddAB subunit AddA [Bacillota bacterium]
MEKPQDSIWTDEQWQVITARGNDILVAAAAGSGKTTVLVERIIQRILNKELEVDELLVVTFTNAAAASMREKIAEKITEKLLSQPTNEYLQRQLRLLERAHISTLHSFCMDVLRKYYYLIDLDPQLRIVSDEESKLLKQEAIELLFEEQYRGKYKESFKACVESFSSDRSTDEFVKLILSLNEFSRSKPNPEQWLKLVASKYTNPFEIVDEETWATTLDQWQSILKEVILMKLEKAESLLTIGKKCAEWEKDQITIYSDEQLIQQLKSSLTNSWDDMAAAITTAKFESLKPLTKKDKEGMDEEVITNREEFKKYRDRYKEIVVDLKEYVPFTLTEMVDDIRSIESVMQTLASVVTEFSNYYAELKQRNGVVDYGDLEHYALEILRDQNVVGDLVPSSAAKDYQNQFKEVLVDEYQDTNQVQETILTLVSKRDVDIRNLFMVGDVKQSIYRFRLAEPDLFVKKYDRFETIPKQGIKIDLNKNFRSRFQVLYGANYLLRQIMDKRMGEIAYNEQAELKVGNENKYPPSDRMDMELVILEKTQPSLDRASGGSGSEDESNHSDVSSDKDVEDVEGIRLEARWIAHKIQELVSKERPLGKEINYRDIVILLRSTATQTPIFQEEFRKYNIPLYAESDTGFLQTTEIRVMLALLQVLDNPYQDIPLVSVMRSPIYRFTEEELAHIRLQSRGGSFFDAVVRTSGLNMEECQTDLDEELIYKVTAFKQALEQMREWTRHLSLSELLSQLYTTTGYYSFVGGLINGHHRQANLRLLLERIVQYENTNQQGLFGFLRFIEKVTQMGKDFGEAKSVGGDQNVVRLMTIHKSKGLEFPVVFVANLYKKFNEQDLRKSVLFHKDLGLGTKIFHKDLRTSYDSLPYLATKEKLKAELRAEEMRILYVALTRAFEKVYLVGSCKDFAKEREKWSNALHQTKEWLLPDYIRAEANHYMDWIGPALVRHHQADKLRQVKLSDEISEDIAQDKDLT